MKLPFVPKHLPVISSDFIKLQEFVDKCKNIFILTGAGVSTESGIPDYRSQGVGLYAKSESRPMKIQDFLNSDRMRKRYWARNYIGWPYFSSVKPNKSHIALSQWEKEGRISWLVTQNVDYLHLKAGSKNVTQLHGTGYVVKCLNCTYTVTRHEYQERLNEENLSFNAQMTDVRPDGDVSLTDEQVSSFVIPLCPKCDGMMKPDIVFFGDNVPKNVVEHSYTKLSESDGVIIAGSSLQVYSGYRFLLHAKEKKIKTALVNIGPTRGDHLFDLKIDGRCGEIIPKIIID